MNQQELEDRLMDFAAIIIETIGLLPANTAGKHLAGQMIRSGTAPALNYGEARAAESRRDFIHKNKIILKELRETFICYKIINRANLVPNQKAFIETSMLENNELVSVFVKTLKTLNK